jgi:hypothetical protein
MKQEPRISRRELEGVIRYYYKALVFLNTLLAMIIITVIQLTY